VASQTFLNAYRSIDRYRYRGRPLLAWLYTITRNLLADRLRGNRRHSPNDLAKLKGRTDDDIADHLDLIREVEKLKREQRDVLVLRVMVGLSLRETAFVLGKSEATIHGWEVRALSNLRRRLSSK
jgi:RNA polymerase sigma-70 factor, ECF subfamily